jgi:hypothetical protein
MRYTAIGVLPLALLVGCASVPTHQLQTLPYNAVVSIEFGPRADECAVRSPRDTPATAVPCTNVVHYLRTHFRPLGSVDYSIHVHSGGVIDGVPTLVSSLATAHFGPGGVHEVKLSFDPGPAP